MAQASAPPTLLEAGDNPSGVTRRAFAIGAAVSVLLAACHDGGKGDGKASDGVAMVEAPKDPTFLSLSQVLTGHADVDPVISARTAQAFRQVFPEVAATFGALATLARQHPKADDLLAAATAPGQREAALAIVAAWYTGSVGSGVTAKSIAYADALMNRPVADALFPPTYQLGGPAWWTAEPPAVDAAGHPASAKGAHDIAGKSHA
jgi:hypothetical protein